MQSLRKINQISKFRKTLSQKCLFSQTSPAGNLLAVKLHSENGVIFKEKYEILISLILQLEDNPRKTMRNQLSLIIG